MITAVLRAMTIPAATLTAAIALGALFAPSTGRAGDFCSLDVDHVLGCGYSSMKQCKASVSGVNGECSPNPFAKEDSVAKIGFGDCAKWREFSNACVCE